MKRLSRIRSITPKNVIQHLPKPKPLQAIQAIQAIRGLSASSRVRQNNGQETYRPHYPRLNIPPAPRTPIQFRDQQKKQTTAPPALHLHPNPTDSQIVHPKLQLVYDHDMSVYPPSMISFLQQYRVGKETVSTPMPTSGLLERLRIANTAHPEGNTLHLVQLREQAHGTILARLYRREELVDMRNKLNKKLERRDTRPARSKYLEFKWSIGRKEIDMRMEAVPTWLAEGRAVTVTIARKRKWIEPNMRDAEKLVQDIIKIFNEISPGPLDVKHEGELGKVVVMQFKPRSASPNQVRVVEIGTPLRKPELVQKVVEVQDLLRKWNVVMVRLRKAAADLNDMPDVVDKDAALAAIRSVARTSHDVRYAVQEDDEADLTLVNMVPGDTEFSPRELEYRIPSDKESRKNCTDWSTKWLKEGKMVKFFVKRTNHDTQEAVMELSRVTRLILRSSGALKQKQLAFYVVDGTELYIPLESRDSTEDGGAQQAINFPKYPGTVSNNNDLWGLVEFWNKHVVKSKT